ncbi:MAG TPA: hypothetical protein VEW04_10900, partial [Allosphingosinicella sp.]|nr:hypothetical protein [Allosphingosinicella sp.]
GIFRVKASRGQSFEFSPAPDQLWQAIKLCSLYNQGARLDLINIDLGQTAHPEIERPATAPLPPPAPAL